MAGSTEADPNVKPEAEVHPLGKSRPPLAVDDLPEPEEVFKVSRLGPLQIVQFVIGPSLIALGISIGSGEWLLGPQAVGAYGFIGVGWVITVSAILQTFYNVEISRYVVATGEVPIVGWGHDHGYGMGHRVGFISGGRGERRELLAVGVTFRDTPESASLWKRWYRLLLVDQYQRLSVDAQRRA